FSDFVDAEGNRHDLIIAAVDRDRFRREIQSSLPRILLNAGTSNVASFRVTRHTYLEGACLRCIARDDLGGDPRIASLARRLRVAATDIEQYERSGSTVPEDALRAAGCGEPDIARFGNHTIQE